MRIAPCLLAALAAAALAAENPCTNGSFEKLRPNGFPAHWAPVGQTVEVTADAHSGKRALRMARTAESTSRETGLNRAWTAHSGEPGAMIDRLKGGIDFWYKAVAADEARLTVQVIPMSADPFENTDSPRAIFDVPDDHVGDGQWHHGRMAYDFTDDEKAKWVHFGARVTGRAGELILDDVSYVETVGPLLAIRALHVVEDEEQPGRRCTIKVSVKNTGDRPAKDVRVRLQPPKGIEAEPEAVRIKTLAPDTSTWARLDLTGPRTSTTTIAVTAKSGEVIASASRTIAPELVLESFGPVSPVAEAGRETAVECVLRNDGHAIVTKPTVRFSLPAGPVTRSAEELPPGRRLVLKAAFTPKKQAQSVEAAVRVSAGNVGRDHEAESAFPVAAPAFEPPPQPERMAIGQAAATNEFAFLGNEHLNLSFRRNDFGFGPGCLFVLEGDAWRRVAWLPRLSRIIYRTPDGVRHDEAVFAQDPPDTARDDQNLQLHFRWTHRDKAGGTWTVNAYFELEGGETAIATEYTLACDQPRQLLAFHGPMLYALDRDEAVFPGLEWLVGNEVSSSALDIKPDHPHRKRFVVHPNRVTLPAIGVHGEHGTVGLTWDVLQEWNAGHDRPSVLFASPDRLHHQRGHLMGLFLPSVPDYVAPNTTAAQTPYPLKAGQMIRLRCRIFADPAAEDALAPMDAWLARRGVPEPTPLPHGSYEEEIQFSMRGYLESLWEPETQQWWTSKGGNPKMSRLARPRAYVADCLLGALLSPDPEVRAACRKRAQEVLGLIGGEPRLNAQRYPGRTDAAYANIGSVTSLLNSVGEDGAWRFDAERPGRGVFEGIDYHVLGPHDAVELGTCARNAYVVLRYARIAGEPRAYEAMRKTLELMETFRVPRAAQVWEVPVHTPDVLAAADAVDAYVEAYRFSGEERWLRDAVAWARRGLPFIYFWGLPEKPWLLGASIPVFGATFYRGSWFGRPVQWNGLRYANAVLDLAEYDDSYPWRDIAELIVHSAVHQQAAAGENAALWPDNIDAITDKRCPWVFAPHRILRNILKLAGREEDPETVIVGQRPRRVHITAPAEITDALWDGERLGFRVAFPLKQQGVVLVSNVTRPTEVRVDGKPIAERAEVEKGGEPGWRYDGANAFLAIRITQDEPVTVRVEGARFRRVERLPEVREAIVFTFDESAEGWVAAHDIQQLAVEDGAVKGTVVAPDPYLIRHNLRVKAEDCPVLAVRMRLTAGPGCQFFFGTDSAPGFSEERLLRWRAKADGEFHTYRLPVGEHPAWRDTITAIRIDPGSGVPSAEFAIDSVAGEKK